MASHQSAEQITDGDLVIHVPADGTRGSGPFYLDRADNYGGDKTRVAVSWLISGPLSWTYDLPKSEIVPVGHVNVEPGDRLGNSFSTEALKRFAPVIKEAQRAFFDRFPNFENGRPSVHVSELKWPMRGYMGRTVLPKLVDLSNADIRGIKFPNESMPLYSSEALVVYAVPQDDSDALIEPTAIGGREFTVMHAHIPEGDASPAHSGYFAVPNSVRQI